MSMMGGGTDSTYEPASAPKAPMRWQNKVRKVANQKRADIYKRSSSTTTTLLTGNGTGGPPRSHASSLLGASQ